MRLIGIIGERWCSSSRASCSVATPGGRSRSSCRNAIRAGSSTTPSIRSRGGWREISEAGASCPGRLLTRRTAGAEGRASVDPAPSPLSCSWVRRRASRRGPCGCSGPRRTRSSPRGWRRCRSRTSSRCGSASRCSRTSPRRWWRSSGPAACRRTRARSPCCCAPPARACSTRSGTSCARSSCPLLAIAGGARRRLQRGGEADRVRGAERARRDRGGGRPRAAAAAARRGGAELIAEFLRAEPLGE